MRYALRNQEKIAAAYSTDYLQQHIIASLYKYFANTSDEVIEDALEFQTINGKEYQVLQINDIEDERCMFEFVIIGRKYDVFRLAYNGRIKG
jgi:hypothetical protein